MTYIAKAMNKNHRIENAAERIARGSAGKGAGTAGSGSVPAAPVALDFSTTRGAVDPPRVQAPKAAVMAVAALGSRSEGLEASHPTDRLGTLESVPEPPASAPTRRVWWKEPVVLAGSALGLSAVLLGFILAPVEEEAPAAVSGAAVQEASPPASTEFEVRSSAAGLEVSSGPAVAGPATTAATVPSSGGGNPVVVRVQIDSGSAGSLQIDSPPPLTADTAPLQPMPTTYYEPLPALELPPPPMLDASSEEPERRSQSSRESSEDYRLEGIFWTEGNPAAIIDDEIVEPGQRVGRLRVLEIHKDHVVVQLDGRTFEMR